MKKYKITRWLIYISPFHLWFWFFSILRHKEERFIFVVYPVLCLSSAITLDLLKKMKFKNLIIILLLFIFGMFGISRTISVVENYSAPQATYSLIYNQLKNETKQGKYFLLLIIFKK